MEENTALPYSAAENKKSRKEVTQFDIRYVHSVACS